MKRLKLITIALLTACAIYAFTNFKREQKSFDVTAYKLGAAIGCMANISSIEEVLDSVEIEPMYGVGNHKWKIATTSDSAQFYFNQGINLYYGFHTIESLASFKKAAKFDSTCAMAWWGQALSVGPTINTWDYPEKPEAQAAIQKAKLLSVAAPPIEKLMVDAMTQRYSADTTQKRAQMNQRYTEAMQKIYRNYTDKPDVAALYADAMMIQHPWNYWNLDGSAKAWTPPIESVLEALLAKTPEHPGANHYYIHLMEGSPFAAKALPSADRLGQLTPGQAHMVHMPSHIYLRTGQYDKSVLINEASVMQYKQEGAAFPPVQHIANRHNNHARQMAANCAMLAGQYTKAIQTALQLQHSIDSAGISFPEPIGNFVQYVFMTPVFINIRFEKWNNLLRMKQPSSKDVYANVLYHFGRGVAYAGLNEVSNAEQELRRLQELMSEKTLTLTFGPLSPPIEGAKVANELLQGFIQVSQKKQDEAIEHFSKAVAFDDGIAYSEPRTPWLLNPRQYLGMAYLKAEQQEKATAVFKQDLQRNADNVWSLYGLYQALALQHKKAEADRIKMKFDKAAAKSDIDFSELEFSTASIK